jgi:hypothetical protein
VGAGHAPVLRPAREQLKEPWAKAEANQMPVRDVADLAQKVIEEANIGSKGW